MNFSISIPKFSSTLRYALLPAALLFTAAAVAQSPATSESHFALLSADVAATESSSSSTSSEGLPNDPSAGMTVTASLSGEAAEPTPQMTPKTAKTAGPIAPKYSKYISAGWTAQPLTSHDKVVLGARDLVSPFTFVGDIFSAGYSHITNGQPNYGTDKGAFGQRLGATVIRDASEGIFTDMVFSPIFHEDPRYYVEGPRYNLVHRTIYSITRPIITRTDSGKNTFNAALLAGYAASSAVSYAYYPAINQNFKDTAATFGGSLAGAAVGDFVSEFSDDVLEAIHLKKKQ